MGWVATKGRGKTGAWLALGARVAGLGGVTGDAWWLGPASGAADASWLPESWGTFNSTVGAWNLGSSGSAGDCWSGPSTVGTDVGLLSTSVASSMVVKRGY